MTSQRLPRRTHATVKIVSTALNAMHRSRSKVDGGAAGASGVWKRRCLEGVGRYLLGDGVCSFLAQVSEGSERADAAAPAKRSLPTVLGELSAEEWLASCVNMLEETDVCGWGTYV